MRVLSVAAVRSPRSMPERAVLFQNQSAALFRVIRVPTCRQPLYAALTASGPQCLIHSARSQAVLLGKLARFRKVFVQVVGLAVDILITLLNAPQLVPCAPVGHGEAFGIHEGQHSGCH